MLRTFDPVEGVASAQGLDVSNYQGQFNWSAAARSGLAFGIYRLTQGLGGPGTNSPDPTAAWNHSHIRDAGLHHGAYHFLDPTESGAAQARYFVDEHDRLGLTGSDMLWLDNETASASPAAVAACAGAFMTELHTLRPHNPMGVYSNLSFGREGYDAGLGNWPAWLAWPSSTAPVPPPPWTKWTFWQWGTRNGVDADAFNGTAGALDAWIASYAPTSPHQHVTDGHASLADLAASRNMQPGAWLTLQARLGGDHTAQALAASAVPKAGLPWYTAS